MKPLFCLFILLSCLGCQDGKNKKVEILPSIPSTYLKNDLDKMNLQGDVYKIVEKSTRNGWEASFTFNKEGYLKIARVNNDITTYDGNGHPVEDMQCVGGERRPIILKGYDYELKGNVVKRQLRNNIAGKIVYNKDTIEYSMGISYRFTELPLSFWEEHGGFAKCKMTYNDGCLSNIILGDNTNFVNHGKPIKKYGITYDNGGNIKFISGVNIKYEYLCHDEKGNWTLQKAIFDDGSTTITNREITYYSENLSDEYGFDTGVYYITNNDNGENYYIDFLPNGMALKHFYRPTKESLEDNIPPRSPYNHACLVYKTSLHSYTYRNEVVTLSASEIEYDFQTHKWQIFGIQKEEQTFLYNPVLECIKFGNELLCKSMDLKTNAAIIVGDKDWAEQLLAIKQQKIGEYILPQGGIMGTKGIGNSNDNDVLDMAAHYTIYLAERNWQMAYNEAGKIARYYATHGDMNKYKLWERKGEVLRKQAMGF
jgi:hypothetical protein